MILQDKNIVVFAASGAIAGGAAREFARQGANVFISARNKAAVEALAKEIEAAGGHATPDVVDATNPQQVEDYVKRVAKATGNIHGTFNGIGGRPKDLGYPEVSSTTTLEHFMIPLNVVVGSTFLTARTIATQMVEQGTGGNIVTLSATLSSMTAPFMAGISAACSAVEAVTRSLAGEYGRSGIRVNCVRGSGMPETRTIQETGAGSVALGYTPVMTMPPIGRPITVHETVSAAAFLLSDLSSGMTAQVVTVCGGVFVG